MGSSRLPRHWLLLPKPEPRRRRSGGTFPRCRRLCIIITRLKRRCCFLFSASSRGVAIRTRSRRTTSSCMQPSRASRPRSRATAATSTEHGSPCSTRFSADTLRRRRTFLFRSCSASLRASSSAVSITRKSSARIIRRIHFRRSRCGRRCRCCRRRCRRCRRRRSVASE
eukprot:Amastigsp_a508336_320.p2 type:complete len:169 gc:universal Amastigsp_a508336_320:618-112(-)